MTTKLDFRKLRYVVTTAEIGSLTGAAAALSITQPALTRCIAVVEEQLGAKLFFRQARGVSPTEEGERFVNRARVLLADLEILSDDFNRESSNANSVLRIGVVPAPYIPLSAPFLSEFAANHPNVDISTTTGRSNETIPQLLTGELDVVFSASSFVQPWPHIQIENIAPLQRAILVRKDHPLAQMDNFSKKDLLNYPVIRAETSHRGLPEVDALYEKLGLPNVRATYTTDDHTLMLALLNRTDAYYALLTDNSAIVDFRKLHQMVTLLDQRLVSEHLCIAHSKARSTSPLIKDLIAIARATMGERRHKSLKL